MRAQRERGFDLLRGDARAPALTEVLRAVFAVARGVTDADLCESPTTLAYSLAATAVTGEGFSGDAFEGGSGAMFRLPSS